MDKHGLAQRVQLQISDGMESLPGPWDLILCNPPYVNAQSMSNLPAEYRAEPELAWQAAPMAWISFASCCAMRPHA